MAYNPNIHHRRSLRLQGYDYSQAGMYYVTMCIHNRECLFGEIIDRKMVLNDAGNIAHDFLKTVPERYPQTAMHEYVIMPNHVHAIIEITETVDHVGAIQLGAIHESPQQSPLRDKRRKMLLSKIVGWYKMNTAKHINIMREMKGVPLWQRNYYEHVIRTEQSYYNIAEYIINNPANWKDDKLYL